MSSIRSIQRLVLAVALTLTTGLAAAGVSPPPSPPSYSSGGGSDDTGLLVMIVVGGLVGSSVNCASDAPSMPSMCTVLGVEAGK